MTTAYHSQYWAHALTLRGATGTIEILSQSIAGARVDLNSHQIDAAQTDDGMMLDDEQIREARKTSAFAALLKEKLEAQKTLKSLEGERNRKRRELFDAQDAIDGQCDELIERIEGQLRQRHAIMPVFFFRWRLA